MSVRKVVSKEEAKRVLDHLSVTLVRALTAIAIGDVKCSRELANAMNISLRNSQRIISILEQMRLIKTLRYGKTKIILSVNKYVEMEILEGVKRLVPYVVDELRLDIHKLDKFVPIIAKRIAERLGLSIDLNKLKTMVKNVVETSLDRKSLPYWIKRILSTRYEHRVRIESDTAQQPSRDLYEPVLEVVHPGAP